MSRTKAELDAQREKDADAHQAHVEAQEAAAKEEPEFTDAGYSETIPGQVEIVAGTPEHVRELRAFSNATSYGSDVNVVVAPEVVLGAPTVVDVPHVQQDGDTLTCTMGNWNGEPTAYHYRWQIEGTDVGADEPSYLVAGDDVGRTAVCHVTAVNAQGETEAPPSNSVVVE